MKLSYTRHSSLHSRLLYFPPLLLGRRKLSSWLTAEKTTKRHNHVDGNDILANALEESKLGFETAQYKGWPTDPKAFDGVDSVVMFCNGGKKHHLVMKHLDQFEKMINDAEWGLYSCTTGWKCPREELVI